MTRHDSIFQLAIIEEGLSWLISLYLLFIEEKTLADSATQQLSATKREWQHIIGNEHYGSKESVAGT
jgi:hypothetical protein